MTEFIFQIVLSSSGACSIYTYIYIWDKSFCHHFAYKCSSTYQCYAISKHSAENEVTFWWISARKTYLQYISNGVKYLLHKHINMFTPQFLWLSMISTHFHDQMMSFDMVERRSWNLTALGSVKILLGWGTPLIFPLAKITQILEVVLKGCFKV